jgi:hypothetical protein
MGGARRGHGAVEKEIKGKGEADEVGEDPIWVGREGAL